MALQQIKTTIIHLPHNTFFKEHLRTTIPCRETFKSLFFPSAIKDWNLLNERVKSSTTISEFKSRPCIELFSLDQS